MILMSMSLLMVEVNLSFLMSGVQFILSGMSLRSSLPRAVSMTRSSAFSSSLKVTSMLTHLPMSPLVSAQSGVAISHGVSAAFTPIFTELITFFILSDICEQDMIHFFCYVFHLILPFKSLEV